jgi:aspartyl-tRNA(Asn)/glutamyl-tRNA(Gln) amidotransferase subunit C
MKITKELLHKMAHLARIEIDPSKEDELMKDMEQIISWVEKLEELDTENVEPLMHMSFEENTYREDALKEDIAKEEALKNAPDRVDDFFAVPKVLNKSNG